MARSKTRHSTANPRSPKVELERFIAKYSPEVAAVARASLAKLRKLVPGAFELVYDNYNALAIGFAPSERASEAVVSIALYPRWVSLFFLQGGSRLPDPRHLLRGSGTRVRHIPLESAKDLDQPAIRALIRHALARAVVPIDGSGRSRIVVRAISAKQRPRRPS